MQASKKAWNLKCALLSVVVNQKGTWPGRAELFVFYQDSSPQKTVGSSGIRLIKSCVPCKHDKRHD